MRRSLQPIMGIGLVIGAGSLFSSAALADPIPGNFWPNPTLETASLTQPNAPAGWRRGGGDFADPPNNVGPYTFDFWDDVAGTVSGTKALRLSDNDVNGNGEWFVPDFGADASIVPIPAAGGDFLRLHFHRKYETVGDMRLTIRGHDGIGGFGLGPAYDFVVNGTTNNAWEVVDVTVPLPAPGGVPITGMQINIASGGGAEVTGFLAVDDIYVARVPEPTSAALIAAVGLFGLRRSRR